MEPTRGTSHQGAMRGRVVVCVAMLLSAALPAAGQTVTGRLIDGVTGGPIDLGLVLMFTEEGDSVGMTVTDSTGHFSVSSPEAGSFLLLASALGYKETPAGVFELGEGGVISIDYRIAPEPLAIDQLVVSLDRPVLQHKLVRTGFVRRLQRGLGRFITPHDIEESSATSTEDLLLGVPGVRIGMVAVTRHADNPEQTVTYPRPDIGQTVQIQAATGGWCTPTIYVDGVMAQFAPDPTSNMSVVETLSTLAPLRTVDAIEVYRRPAEIPVEYSSKQTGSGGQCGVLVVWTKSGPAPGGRALGNGIDPSVVAGGATSYRPLPAVKEGGSSPTEGERIRVQVARDVGARLGLGSPWEGTFITVRDEELIGRDASRGAVAVPVGGIEALQVLRSRGRGNAYRRGAVAGAELALGVGTFLRFLCWFSGCHGQLGATLGPAAATGVVFGALVAAQGPGERWVSAPVPEPAPSGASR